MYYKTLIKFLLIFFVFSNCKLLSQCFSSKYLPEGYITETTGEDFIDSILISEIQKQKYFFDLDIDFRFMYEYKGKNAFYYPFCERSNCHGTIFLGVKMLYEQINKTGGLESTRAILAHEFGHCIQSYVNWTGMSKYKELHSDFMAGFYIGKTYNYKESQLNTLFQVFYELGDYYYWSINHHGTPYERKCAFQEGYYYAKENQVSAVEAHSYALKYVSADDPCAVRRYKANTKKYYDNLARKNVGNIVVTVLNDAKYDLITKDSLGNKLNIFFNQSKVKYRWSQNLPNNSFYNIIYTYSQPIQKINQYVISNVVATNSHPLQFYKDSFLFGYWLKFNITIPVNKGRTTYVTIKGNTLSYDIEY
jgi:hypothetical protein